MAKLYVVPTPVGNLEDMTLRAIRVLKEADCVLAEDTRTSGILMKHFDIHTRMQSHHKFNEHDTVAGLVERLKAGETIALISDAGTPAISDPGFLRMPERGNTGRVPAGSNGFRTGAGSIGTTERKILFRRFSSTEKRPGYPACPTG